MATRFTQIETDVGWYKIQGAIFADVEDGWDWTYFFQLYQEFALCYIGVLEIGAGKGL
jgi:hypothetical protein